MIRTFRLLAGLAVAVTGSYAAAQSAQGLAEAAGRGLLGEAAPALVVETIDGGSIDLGQLYGKKAVYLKFWATWCVPCMQQMPHFERAYETAGPDLVVIGVNTWFNDSLPDVRAVVRDKGLKMPIVIDDGRLAAALRLRVTPQHVVIGRDGRISYVGHLADERLDNALRAAQAQPRERPSTHGAAPAAIARFGVGDQVPDLSAETLGGDTFRTRSDERRPTALVFLSPWCESYLEKSRPTYSTSCREVREQVAALASGDAGVRWLGVASGLWATMDALRKYDTELAPAIPLTLDEYGDWFRAFDVTQVPTIVIVDAGGRIVKRIEGFDVGLAQEVQRIRER
jgi:thiol-disulfide isomerase/thioredoxin